MASPSGSATVGPVALLGVLAGLLWAIFPPAFGPTDAPMVTVGIVLAVAFVAVEMWPLTLEIRGDTLNLTLSGVVVIVGLFFAGPLVTLVARLVGAGLSLAFRWHNAPAKLVVNLTAMVVEVWATAAVLAVVVPSGRVVQVLEWFGVLLAGVAGELGMSVVVLAAMRMMVGAVQRDTLRALWTGVVASTLMVWVFAVLSLSLVEIDPWLLGVVVAAMALLIHSNRQRHDLNLRYQSLRGLYRFMTRVDEAEDTTAMASRILDEAAEVVGAIRAALFVVDDSRTTRLSNARGSLGVTWVPREQVEALAADVGSSARLVDPTWVQEDYMELLDHAEQTIVASLGNPDVTGLLVLSGRPRHLPEFDVRDVELAAAVAHHAGASLAEARLLDRLREERFRVEQMGLTDTLTGLRNRDGLMRDVPRMDAGAVIVLGLRDLVEINGALGHEVGERMVLVAAQRLRRMADQHAMIAAAFGGGRFALVAPDATTVLAGSDLCRQLLQEVSGPMEDGPLALDISPVLGIALAPTHGFEPAELVRAADKALGQAIDNGMGVAWFDADYDRESTERLHLAGELRRALDQGHLTVAYQPKVDLASGRVVGVEALARWPHAERGMIPPTEFIDVAERTGLIRPLTLVITQLALAQADEWRRQGLDLSMSINLSIAVMQDASMARQIVALVRSHEIPPERIIVEITESQVMEDVERGSGMLAIFGAAGVSLSVDDFGTGYSSLSQVKNLPVQELKIDRSFVMDMASNRTDQVIVTSVLRLAEELDLRVVAEGIEDETVRRMLEDLGCHHAQGFLFAKPLPASQIPAAVRDIESRPRGDVAAPLPLRRRFDGLG